jgi:hypothetical protein
MKAKVVSALLGFALALAAGLIALLLLGPAPDAQAQMKPKAAKAACKTHRGKGWAFTENMARFQAWEIVAQTTGNWPLQTDTFRNERYRCRPDGSGYTCYSWIDVCKSG